jgi:hypothetical protein
MITNLFLHIAMDGSPLLGYIMKFLKKKKILGPREGGVPTKIQEKGEGRHQRRNRETRRGLQSLVVVHSMYYPFIF